ncbi:hypothetical protein ACFQ3C_07040 [Seohaeicola saemankumensis]|uniref:Uncharacterized protein n=1 Tax=Seohaeicola saemankumensis TaxID=481181 RepID=A0ABW3TFB7_9RHOB
MSPQNRHHPLFERPHAPVDTGRDHMIALDLLQGLSLPDACNIETWLDRIEYTNGRGSRP